MANKKQSEKNIRKLIKVGTGKGSLALTVPVEMLTALGWKEKQRVTVKRKASKLIVSDWKKKKS
jgi:hypothetical protein